MHKARWGMMTHFLADLTDIGDATEEASQKFWRDWDAGIRSGSILNSSAKSSIEQWNRRVESVNAENFARRIADTGAGISADAVPHVFERFYRADTARSRQDGGFGLGLAIVKWIAESHHGAVALATTPGAGSTFTVTLPR